MKHYNVWITLHGSSAQSAGIIGSTQKTRSSWPNGRLEYLPVNDGSQVNFRFDARDDSEAFSKVSRLFGEARPADGRPLSGKSYIRTCR